MGIGVKNETLVGNKWAGLRFDRLSKFGHGSLLSKLGDSVDVHPIAGKGRHRSLEEGEIGRGALVVVSIGSPPEYTGSQTHLDLVPVHACERMQVAGDNRDTRVLSFGRLH